MEGKDAPKIKKRHDNMPLWRTGNQEVKYQLIKSITYCFILFNVHNCVNMNCILISTAFLLHSFLLCGGNLTTQCFQSGEFHYCLSDLVFASLSFFHFDDFGLLSFEQGDVLRLSVRAIDGSSRGCGSCFSFRLSLLLLLLGLLLRLSLSLFSWLSLFDLRGNESNLRLNFLLLRG